MFFLSLYLMSGKLQLTLNLAHKEVVDEDIVGWFVKIVPDAN